MSLFLGPADRRFGFSVVGGVGEKFPPRIEEIAKGKYSTVMCCVVVFSETSAYSNKVFEVWRLCTYLHCVWLVFIWDVLFVKQLSSACP